MNEVGNFTAAYSLTALIVRSSAVAILTGVPFGNTPIASGTGYIYVPRALLSDDDATKDYDHKPCEFYAVMNMLNSDLGRTMAKYGADRPEIWASLAHDWLADPDAEPDKLGRYWRDIVLHKK